MRRIKGLRIVGKEVRAHCYFLSYYLRDAGICQRRSSVPHAIFSIVLMNSIIPDIVHVDTRFLRRISHQAQVVANDGKYSGVLIDPLITILVFSGKKNNRRARGGRKSFFAILRGDKSLDFQTVLSDSRSATARSGASCAVSTESVLTPDYLNIMPRSLILMISFFEFARQIHSKIHHIERIIAPVLCVLFLLEAV